MFSAVSFFSKLPPASLPPPAAPVLAGELWYVDSLLRLKLAIYLLPCVCPKFCRKWGRI
ncbi:hypothetical protein SLEP1_g60074 [Rubroshorea leprosula]|uniref:Uncharacterized protein n=1 Tax=Rubroshorea leprosula TaxID=152421 RepID=A0AAV5MWT3_9ROSI|nr:hypothetical protein SLEP1_g60074 [Rubroshorea leprosula]